MATEPPVGLLFVYLIFLLDIILLAYVYLTDSHKIKRLAPFYFLLVVVVGNGLKAITTP